MSDDTNPQGTPPSWTPPPPGNSTPPPLPQQESQAYQGSGDPTGGVSQPAKRSGGPNINLSAPLVLGIVSLVAIVFATFIKETKISFWDSFGGLWSLFAIAAAALTLLPALRSMFSLSADLAAKLAAGGAAALVLWWVLFVLPQIGSSQVANLTFLATIGVAAGALAVWTSPDNILKTGAGSVDS